MNLEQVKCICTAYSEFRKAEKKLGQVAGMFSDATASDFLYKAEEPLIDAVTVGMNARQQTEACEFLEKNDPVGLYEKIKEIENEQYSR